jgi:hypothetical protein
MRTAVAAASLLALAAAAPAAVAQDAPATTGGIISAAAGAAIAGAMEPRRRGYYRYQGDCWLRGSDGGYIRVSQRHCR